MKIFEKLGQNVNSLAFERHRFESNDGIVTHSIDGQERSYFPEKCLVEYLDYYGWATDYFLETKKEPPAV